MKPFVSPSGRRPWIALAVAGLMTVASLARAQEPPAGPAPTPAPVVEPAKALAPESSSATTEVSEPARPVRTASPMMLEIRGVLAAENEKLAGLRERAKSAATPEIAIVIQREIERVKFDTEIALLRTQAKFARAAGRTEVAARIERAVADLLNPPKPLAPAARPAPDREDASR